MEELAVLLARQTDITSVTNILADVSRRGRQGPIIRI